MRQRHTRIRASIAPCLAGVLAVASRAAAQPRPDGLYAATFADRALATTVKVPFGSSVAHARLRRRMPAPRSRWLYALDNGNQTYRVTLAYPGRACPATTVLLVDGTPAPVGGTRLGGGRCVYDFVVDRAQADRVAATFGVVREDRAPQGERVAARFALASSTYRRGAPIEVRLTLQNPADAPAVQREAGCCHFAFAVHHNGHRVADLACVVRTCPVVYVELSPGTTAEDRIDVGRWANIQAPGHYRLEGRYTVNFARSGVPTSGVADLLARVWERTFTGVVEFDVQ